MPVLRGCPHDHTVQVRQCFGAHVCVRVREPVKEDDGNKSDMKKRARLALPELASKERTDVPAVTLDG